MSNSLKFIQFAVEQGVLQFGDFTLKSGRSSPYFFNAGLFNDGRSLSTFSKFYAQAIVDSGIEFDLLFGPAYKGIPLVAAVAISLERDFGKNYPYAFNRKEVKSYADGGQIVGSAIEGNVLIIDDVITAGTAIKESVQIIQDAGASVAGVVIAFDRQERSTLDETKSAVAYVEKSYGLQAITVATANELIEYAKSNKLYVQHIARLEEYLNQHT